MGSAPVGNFNRVALFGRWIVDCGHDSFLTEIHPPLLTAAADASGSVDVTATLENSVTRVRVTSLPYLVSQKFEDGDLRTQLAKQLALVKIGAGPGIPLTAQMKATPTLLAPFSGLHIFQFTVRPPVVPNQLRRVPNPYQLKVDYQFTVRTGIVVQLAPDGTDGVLVTVEMNDVNFKKDDATLASHRQDFKITADVIGKLDPEYATLFNLVIGETAFADPDPIKALVLNKGFASNLYTPLTAPSATPVHSVWLKQLVGNTPVVVDDAQPFPIIGFLNVHWANPAVTRPPPRPATVIVPPRHPTPASTRVPPRPPRY